MSQIRRVQDDEQDTILHQQLSYAFWPTPLPAKQDDLVIPTREMLQEATTYVLFENEQPQATASYSPMSQNIRGRIYPTTAAVWGVASHPEARRKGYARQVITELFRVMYEEGIPITTLYAFRESFYVRLGYVTFPLRHIATFSPQALLPLLKQKLEGQVRLSTISEGFTIYQDYMRKRQLTTHGMGVFSNVGRVELLKKNEFWLATAYLNEEPCGLMRYKLDPITGVMNVMVFYYDNQSTKYLLLEWLARHVDQAKTIEMRLHPGELPETWYPDLNVQLSSKDAPLARVVNVLGLDGIPIGPGAFSAQIRDLYCPWNEGNFRFENAEGVLKVTRSERADFELSIQGLSALLFGTHDPASFALREWGSPDSNAQETLRQMFPPLLPYLHETF
ncbi:GNAT family N-acetyltransferase [Tengunoibacter tsumagoiensis]|uniref:N-acetyltransferase domain-containing protein n=1 Tax=Tengunoibacter tsumagoiensis TaxID=2014871 RepID=A0A402A6T1_9CHLR|nr:GNAT family N-acetyltransferase [Tengunoibacter tsumagoiensis]GCE14736.1 hypothetical protein KTT_45950 [Tengunoibacter tsumagoiensis]